MKKSGFLLLVLSTLLSCGMFSQEAWANRAEVEMLPTRVVMGSHDRYTTVIVKNVGNATGDFSISLIDMQMKQSGMVVPLAKGTKDPHSAIPYIHIAPRSFELHPGEFQNVRIMLRKPEDLPAGEYRSHLRLRLDNDDVEATQEAKKNPNKKETSITVRANLVLIIPVIFRQGKTTLQMGIQNAKLVKNKQGTPTVSLDLTRQGNMSSMGDFTVTYYAPGGTSAQKLEYFPGIPVYADIGLRHVNIALSHVPKGVDLSKGRLEVTYAAQKKDGSPGTVLAQASIKL